MIVGFLSWLHDILIRLFGDIILAMALYKVLRHEWKSGARVRRARRAPRHIKYCPKPTGVRRLLNGGNSGEPRP
jgi:hypothetical protein